ncbi:MAG: hypothetical protein KJO69_02850 [Gammaproteobacteria bacterium]|nr:hypothetical protein [Gammaproteobacteria bacterium]
MATRTEIATKVLQKLGILQDGATASANDITVVNDKYDSLYAILKANDLVSWGSAEDIPDTHIIPIVGLLARECLEEFTATPTVAGLIIGDEQRYIDKLREFEYQYYIPNEDEGHYY